MEQKSAMNQRLLKSVICRFHKGRTFSENNRWVMDMEIVGLEISANCKKEKAWEYAPWG
jgi:hypothetical protein